MKTAAKQHPSVQQAEVKNLLRQVSKLLNSQEVAVNYQVAAWFLMADLYGYLSYLHTNTPANAHKALQEALKALEYAKTIINDSAETDPALICQYNTFGVADPDKAMELIQHTLLPELSQAAEDKPFFQIAIY